MAILEVIDLTKKFGGLEAVKGLSFDVNEDEILGLIGPNGAGKSTVFNLVSGFLKPTKGKMIFFGNNITNLGPHKIAGLGLVRTFQVVSLILNQTVYENVKIAHHLQRNSSVFDSFARNQLSRRDEEATHERTEELLERMGLSGVKNVIAGSLPHGFQKILSISIAMAAKPKLLLLDEPTAGLSAAETGEFIKLISKIREEGVHIIIVEHDMKLIMKICDRILVLNFGELIAEGAPKEVSENEKVISAYLGFNRSHGKAA